MTLSTRSVGNSVMTQNVFSCHGNVAVAQTDDDGICLLKYLTNPEKKINRVRYFKTDSNRRLSWKIKIDWRVATIIGSYGIALLSVRRYVPK